MPNKAIGLRIPAIKAAINTATPTTAGRQIRRRSVLIEAIPQLESGATAINNSKPAIKGAFARS